MLPEVRVLLERARSARLSLEGLLDVLPADYWWRTAPGDRWNVTEQVAHVASADLLLAALLERVAAGERAAWVGGTRDPAELSARREPPFAGLGELPVTSLRMAAAEARAGVEAACALLELPMLEANVQIAGAMDRWGVPLSWGLRGYLASWAAHDSAHEADIRAAIATAPDLSTVALTQRRRG